MCYQDRHHQDHHLTFWIITTSPRGRAMPTSWQTITCTDQRLCQSPDANSHSQQDRAGVGWHRQQLCKAWERVWRQSPVQLAGFMPEQKIHVHMYQLGNVFEGRAQFHRLASCLEKIHICEQYAMMTQNLLLEKKEGSCMSDWQRRAVQSKLAVQSKTLQKPCCFQWYQLRRRSKGVGWCVPLKKIQKVLRSRVSDYFETQTTCFVCIWCTTKPEASEVPEGEVCRGRSSSRPEN